jgi:phosphomannomutase
MDLKERVHDFTSRKGIHRLDNRLIYAVGFLGILIIAVTIWLSLGDRRSNQEAALAQTEVNQAAEQLSEPVQALNRVLFDEQVQALAARALSNPATIEDLNSYLNGRIGAIREARVFGNDLNSLNPMQLGPNGFAVLDMLLTLQENRFPQLQIHQSVQPTVMVDAVKISSGDTLVGYLVVFLDPDYVLSQFNPPNSQLGYLGLSQYNGRQKSTILREVGDSTLVKEVPEHLSVTGTRFRIEYPMQYRVVVLDGRLLIMILLAGGFLIAAAVWLFSFNKALPERKVVRAPALKDSVPARAEGALPADRKLALQKPETTESEIKPEKIPKKKVVATPDPPPMRLRYDIAERRRMQEHEHEPVELAAEIFRAYDIRGIIDKTLDAGVARQIGQAVGTVTLERNAGPVVVARDGRLSGPYLQDGMIEGILSTGCDVLDIGAVPTGVLYFAAHELAKGSGVMITGSHNPPDYNGFKIMVGGDTLHGREIHALYKRITDGNVQDGDGEVTRKDVVPAYIERIAGDIQLDRPLKVVIDCGNGIGGVCAADVLRAIGAEVLPLFDEVDGTFPNHHPDPSEPENLKDLIDAVRLMDADLGLALDGDADRLGVVTLAGNIIFPDRIMMLLAMDVLDRNPGATIIYDVKCTNHLADVIRDAGGVPMMYKTGHSLIKAKMKEIGSPFAGEMSGHFFFEERWYGVDDGIYSAARLLEILSSAETPPEAILNALPTSYSTPELKVQMSEGENFKFMDVFRQVAKFPGAEVSTIDGVRADFKDGWGLVRCSNTTPVLVVRFDAESETSLERIKDIFRTQMLAVNPDLDLSF